MFRFRPLLLLLLLALPLISGCGGEPRPVAEVEVARSEIELPHGAFTSLDLSWRAVEPLSGRGGELQVFVHLIEEPGGVVRTFDHPWPGSWHPGRRMEYSLRLHQSALAPPLAPGSYGLTLGLYNAGGRRWPLSVRGEPVDRREYRVVTVHVPAQAGGEPLFQFSPEWRDSEPGRDRQILSRRWLEGSGRLQAVGVAQAGTLWLRLVVPSADGDQELVLLEGATQQGVEVRSECGGVEVRLAGAGNHDVTLPITPPAEGDVCGVEVTPNFYLLELESARRLTVSLDILAWQPEPDGG